MDAGFDAGGGRRERRKRETLERIAQRGLELFIENGYEGTTLEAIATASGISRRTFFYYFKSKEDVLLAHDSGRITEALSKAIRAQSTNQRPIDAARNALIFLADNFHTENSIVVDRLLRSTEALRFRKDASLLRLEHTLAEAFYELWPAPSLRSLLRADAMIAIGALRLALEQWREEDGAIPLSRHLKYWFDVLSEPIRSPS